MTYTHLEIAKTIDHSILNPAHAEADLENGCRMGRAYNVATICVMPYFVKRCAEILDGSTVLPSTPIGFPHGGHATAVKVAEARQAMADGAVELDMVVNISKVLSEDWNYVAADIRAVAEFTHANGGLIKVIFENCFLQDAHKIRLCEICGEIEVDWVKTSTGFGGGGATDDDLRLMRRYSPPRVQIKAAGGVRTLDRLLEVRALGVTRAGATQTRAILDECRHRLGMA